MSIKQTILTFVAVSMGLTMPVSAQSEAKKLPESDVPMVHDPVMAWENGVYYIFSTGQGLSMFTSTDSRHWSTRPQEVFHHLPAWTCDSVPGFKKHVWAPDVIYWHNRWYVAYSCSSFGKNTSAIGLASRLSLDGDEQWRDDGCLIASKEGRDDWNAIDPNFVVDSLGQPWLTWGSFWDGIQLIPLNDSLQVKEGARPHTIARRYARGNEPAMANPTSDEAGPNAIEAPFIFRHGGYYYLFVSWDYCCQGMKSSYRVAVGRSKQIEGPYLDADGVEMLQGGGTLLVEGDKKEYEALGHCSVYHLSEGDVFLCHGYSVRLDGAPVLVQRRLLWKQLADGTDWPILR